MDTDQSCHFRLHESRLLSITAKSWPGLLMGWTEHASKIVGSGHKVRLKIDAPEPYWAILLAADNPLITGVTNKSTMPLTHITPYTTIGMSAVKQFKSTVS